MTMLLFLLHFCLAVIDFSSVQYPFPLDNLTMLNQNLDNPATNCSLDLMSDGKCDAFNNNLICKYDGGDCCRYTCEKNCAAGCLYECGSNGYNCIQDTLCHNCVNGDCYTMSECFSTTDRILQGLENCLRSNMIHGNTSTSNFYCGLDPNKTMLHNYALIEFHYPGCGLASDICSVYQCCTDISKNYDTINNCTDIPRNASVFNLDTHRTVYMNISCLSQSQACFINNSRLSKGECCECWNG